MNVNDRIKKLGIILPEAPLSVGSYSTGIISDNLLCLSGSGGADPGKLKYYGKLGSEVCVTEGRECAEAAILALLSTAKKHLGSLERVEQIIKVTGFVNSVPEFTEHPKVIDGASEILLRIFGPENGSHARTAVGVSSLPFNIPVEIEMIIKIKQDV